MANLRGCYLAFAHDYPADWDWLRAWQPSVVRLMVHGSHDDPASVDVNRIRRVYETSGGAQILLRCWDVDDRNGEAHAAMGANPAAEAQKQATWWARLFDRAAGVPREKLLAGLINEPNPAQMGGPLYAYTEQAMRYGSAWDVRMGVYMFSVGNPGKAGESEYDWPYFARLEAQIVAGHHVAVVHEYMQPEGMYSVWTDDQGRERRDYGSLIGRHLSSGLTQADLIIGEWGIDGLLFNRHAHPQYGNNGWLSFRDLWGPERYADEYVECIRKAAPNVIAICPFVSDAGSHQWDSFEVQTAYGALLSRKALTERPTPTTPETPATTPPTTIHLPVVSAPPTAVPTEPQPPAPPTWDDAPNSTWQRSIAFVLGQEGGLSTDPNDSGNYVNGVFVGTKYGISARAHPGVDVVNLTLTEAKIIYARDYWRASGANQMPWPMCLAHLDLAVNGGVGRAQQALDEAGPDFTRYMAWRLAWYTRLPQFDLYGRAWIRRCSDLMVEATRPA